VFVRFRKPLKLIILLAATAVFLPQADRPAAKNPFGGDARAIESGRVSFRMHCSECHGLRGTGGRSGPDLTRGTFAAGDTDADLYNVILNGVPGTEMPPSTGRLDDDDRWRLVAYVRSLNVSNKGPVPGDRAAGENLFWGKGNCGGCHSIGARGSSVGPNLTRSGRQRSVAYLRESIVSPEADITPGYATVTVVTRDGRKIVGVEKGFDNFWAALMDMSGRYYSFQRDDVTSITREFRSLMPANYGRLFSDRELQDLVAFLAGQDGGTR
jgi:putative heme-binding domain-containing protein